MENSKVVKILVAVISCHKLDRTKIIRETWAKTLKAYHPNIDLRFFYGYGAKRKTEDDEIFLSVDDTYRGLVHKVKSVIRWAIAHGYDYLLKVDDDTFISQRLIFSLGSNSAEYTGHSTSTEVNAKTYAGQMSFAQSEKLLNFGGDYACGGCYMLGRRSMEILDRTKVTSKSFEFMGISNLYDLKNPIPPCEDRWVGHVLAQNGIKLIHDSHFSGQTDDIEFIKARLTPVLSGQEINEADFKAYLLLAPLKHFNCKPEDIKKLYESELGE